MSIGIFTMPIWLSSGILKKNTPSGHSHAITQVWLEEEKQWAVFDPSFNVWFEVDGRPADISQILKSVRSKKSYVTISNVTKRRFDRAGDCTRIGLLDIGFRKGNICGEKKEMLHFIPDTYLKWIREYAQNWMTEEMLRESLDYILATPAWAEECSEGECLRT